MKFPDGTIYGGRKTHEDEFFFLFLNLGAVSRTQLQEISPTFDIRVGIIATTFEKTRLHFFSDVFAAVAVVVAKLPHREI